MKNKYCTYENQPCKGQFFKHCINGILFVIFNFFFQNNILSMKHRSHQGAACLGKKTVPQSIEASSSNVLKIPPKKLCVLTIPDSIGNDVTLIVPESFMAHNPLEFFNALDNAHPELIKQYLQQYSSEYLAIQDCKTFFCAALDRLAFHNLSHPNGPEYIKIFRDFGLDLNHTLNDTCANFFGRCLRWTLTVPITDADDMPHRLNVLKAALENGSDPTLRLFLNSDKKTPFNPNAIEFLKIILSKNNYSDCTKKLISTILLIINDHQWKQKRESLRVYADTYLKNYPPCERLKERIIHNR